MNVGFTMWCLPIYDSSQTCTRVCEFCCNCQGVSVVPEDFVAEQLKSVLSDMQVDVVSLN